MSAPQVTRLAKEDPDRSARTGDIIVHHHSTRPLLLSAPLVEQLHVEVSTGAQFAPPGGAEIGGILVAPRRRAGWIHVERLEPIRTEYRFGPSFQLSPSDFEGLERLVASIGDTEAVVGFYRSWTGGETGLRDSDREICQTILAHNSYPADFQYLILLTSKTRTVLSADIARRENGDWDDWQTYMLHSAMLAPAAPLSEEQKPLIPAGQLPARPQARDVPPSPEQAPEPKPTVGWKAAARRLPWWTYAAAATIVISGGIGGLIAPHRSSHGLHAGFAATLEGGMWKLTWNRESVAAMHPSQAVLSILDGDQAQQVPLTSEDLASGTAYYMPRSKNLIFELQVLSPDEPLAKEQVRVLSADPGSVSR